MNQFNLNSLSQSNTLQDFIKLKNETYSPIKTPSEEIKFVLDSSPSQSIIQNLQTLLQQGNSSTSSDLKEKTDKSIQTDLQNKIYSLDPKIQSEWDQLNFDLVKQGKSSVNFLETTQKTEEILDNSYLTQSDKEVLIGSLGDSLGLSHDQMKRFFTQRLGNIYAEITQKTSSADLKKIYQEKSENYKKMFPPPPKKSFWSKLFGAFKSFFTIFSKIIDQILPLLKAIPGIGQIFSVAWDLFKRIIQPKLEGTESPSLE